MFTTAPHLSPRTIAKSLEELRSWQLLENADLTGMHGGLLRAQPFLGIFPGLHISMQLENQRVDRAIRSFAMQLHEFL